MQTVFVYITTRDVKEARVIGRHLVQSHLAAGVNIFDRMNSMYIWRGEFRDEQEAVLIAKTTADRMSGLIAAVKLRHSYECPCIVSLPVSDGDADFLNWIAAQVAPPPE